MKFTPLNDLKRPPVQKVTTTWKAIIIIGAIFVVAALIVLNKLFELSVLRGFEWRQYLANTGYYWLYSLLMEVIVFVLMLILVIVIVLYCTLAERKLIAYFQIRQGPNRAGPWGIIQPFADMFKILIKEDITPLAADKWVFNIAPMLIFLPTLLVFAVLPMSKGYVDMDHRIMPTDTPANRQLYDNLYDYNILDITFAHGEKAEAKKRPNLENNIQFAVGKDFISRATGAIGSTTLFTAADRERAYNEYSDPDFPKPPPPRADRSLLPLSPAGESHVLRTQGGGFELWLKGEEIEPTGTSSAAINRLNFYLPDTESTPGGQFSIEPANGNGILLTSDGLSKEVALDSGPITLHLGGETLTIKWQTDQTYTFYVIPRDINVGLLFIIAITSLAVVVIFMAGWSSNNKWSLFGAMRSAAQMISYEVPMGLSLLGVVLMAGTTSMVGLVEAQRELWYVIPQFLGFLIYFTCSVAEVNRCPFDMPEAESELVGGFHTEYTGLKFGFFFLAEYANMFIAAALATTIFFGGWYGPGILDDWSVAIFGRFTSGLLWFFLKSWIFVAVLIWIRATFPRLRVDHMMEFAWKVLFPLAILNLLYTGFFAFSDWRLKTWLENLWRIRDNYLFAVFQYPNYIFSAPLLLIILILILTDVYGHYREIKMKYEVVWTPPGGRVDVPTLRRELAKPPKDYKYIHKGFKYGKWLKGSETSKDVPGNEDTDEPGH